MPDDAEDCGCDGAEEFASAALADLDENEPDLNPDPRGNSVRQWAGLIAPYGVPTGDGRRFAAGALTSRDLPAPVKWQRTDSAGHSTSVVVGRIDALHYGTDGVEGRGIFFTPDPAVLPRLAEDSAEAYQLTKDKVIGPSVDLDDMEFHPLGNPDDFSAEDGKRPEIEVTKGRISAVTLVPIPAFAEARPFSLSDVDADQYATETALTASGVRDDMEMYAVAPDDHDWDVAAWLLAGDTAGALYSDGTTALFPVAEMVDGQLAIVPGAVADAISVLAFNSDSVQLDESTKEVLRERLGDLAAACDLPAPPWDRQGALVASATTRTKLPAAAFTDPGLTAPTPPQFETLPNGRIRTYGHIASWRTCHIGFQNRCVTAPKSPSGYSYFHVGSVETDKGRIPTGKLTLGGGHADTSAGFQAAVAHYDNTSTAMADVVVGNDKHGLWYSGIVRPGVTQDQLDEFAASPLSGDWRRVGGALELVAALAVNTPGFPIPQVREDGAGAFALVAAGAMMDPDRDAKMLKLKAKKKKGMPVNDPDKDGDNDGGYSLEDVAGAVFTRFRAEERAQREAASLAATLEGDFSELDQLDAAQFASVFEE